MPAGRAGHVCGWFAADLGERLVDSVRAGSRCSREPGCIASTVAVTWRTTSRREGVSRTSPRFFGFGPPLSPDTPGCVPGREGSGVTISWPYRRPASPRDRGVCIDGLEITMTMATRPQPPAGLRRALFRAPVRLYRMHLGALLGGRFMLLNHVGRVSGTPRQAVLEIVEHDPRSGAYLACSGFGTRADWYRNILKTPQVTIQVGRRTLPVTAQPLAAGDGGELMARYAERHPRSAAKLTRLMGFAVDGSPQDYRKVGRDLPFVRFDPRP